MSNKLVFKGTINGVEYTDRDAFNAALQKAVDAGENVQASSQSSYKQDPEMVKDISMDLPFLTGSNKFDPNSIKGLTADIITKRLEKAVENNVTTIGKMNQDQRDKYTDILTEVVNELSDHIKELDNRIAALRARRDVIDDMAGFYAATRDMTDGGITPDKKDFEADEEKIKTKTTLRADQKEDDVQLSPEVENAIKTLGKFFDLLK